jgi:translocator protein
VNNGGKIGMRKNFIFIPLVTIIVAIVGSVITSHGMDWYATVLKPDFTPPGKTIGMVWTVIFILSTISALIFWNIHKPYGRLPQNARFSFVVFFFLANAFLNVFWSYLFFSQHLIYQAFYEAVVLDLTVIMLIILMWRVSKWASLLLFPYAIWTAFASYLTLSVWMLNSI